MFACVQIHGNPCPSFLNSPLPGHLYRRDVELGEQQAILIIHTVISLTVSGVGICDVGRCVHDMCVQGW
jgi:hypothetical protein